MKKLNSYFKVIIFIFAFLVTANISYSQWTVTGNLAGLAGYRPQVSVVDENTAFATGGVDVNVTYKTTNGGADWIQLNTDTLRPFWAIWAKDANTLFAGDDGNGSIAGGIVENLYKTTNNGINWLLIYSTTGVRAAFRGIKFSNSIPSFGIALGETDGNYNIYKTRDGGNTWTKTIVPGYPDAHAVYHSLNVIDSLFYAFGTSIISPSIVITTDGGATWNLRDLNLPSIGPNFTRGVAFKEDKLTGIAASWALPLIARTTDGGLNWQTINVGNNITSTTSSVLRWIEGTDICYLTVGGFTNEGVLKSTNGGLNWIQMSTANLGIFYFDFKRIGSNIYGYANSEANVFGGNEILKIIDATVGINQISELVPDGYKLSQNYPNPFNPVTNLEFGLPAEASAQAGISELGFVSLKIYDMLGKEVAILVNENLNPGTYKYNFDASDLQSGVYFYKLQTDNFSEVKKMTLLK